MLLNNRVGKVGLMAVLLLLLTGCDTEEKVTWSGGDLRGVNHTQLGIGRFSVNGSGGPNISPFGEGGGACCISLPDKWQPERKAQVEWEVDTDPTLMKKFPGYLDAEKYQAWEKKAMASIAKYSATVDIPEYGKERCGLTVHFFPCQQIKVTTSCWTYGAQAYPIKEPREMKEPKVCPK